MVSQPVSTRARQSTKKPRKKASSSSPTAAKRKFDTFDFVADGSETPQKVGSKSTTVSNKSSKAAQRRKSTDAANKNEEKEEIKAKKTNVRGTRSAKVAENPSNEETKTKVRRRPASVGSALPPSSLASAAHFPSPIQKRSKKAKLSTGIAALSEESDVVELIPTRQANQSGNSNTSVEKVIPNTIEKVLKKSVGVSKNNTEEITLPPVVVQKNSKKSTHEEKHSAKDETKTRKSSSKKGEEVKNNRKPSEKQVEEENTSKTKADERNSKKAEEVKNSKKSSSKAEEQVQEKRQSSRKKSIQPPSIEEPTRKSARNVTASSSNTAAEMKPTRKSSRIAVEPIATVAANQKRSKKTENGEVSSKRDKTSIAEIATAKKPSVVEYVPVDKSTSPPETYVPKYPTGDDNDIDEKNNAEEILLRQISNPANTDKPRQRAKSRRLTQTPKPSEILRSFIPTAFSLSPSPGAEASCDEAKGDHDRDSLGSRKIASKRKSKIDAMSYAEKRRLTGNLMKIGEDQKSFFPAVTSGYASLVSPPRNFSKMISPGSTLTKRTPRRPPPTFSRSLAVPEKGNIMDLSPISMRTARSLDLTPMHGDQSLYNLLYTPARPPSSSSLFPPSHKQQRSLSPVRPLSFPSPHPHLRTTTPSVSSSAVTSSLGPPPPRRSVRSSGQSVVAPSKSPPQSPTKEPLPVASEPLGPDEALAEAVSMMKRKKMPRKRKTKTEEVEDEERATKEQSEVANMKSFFENLDAEPTDSFLEFE